MEHRNRTSQTPRRYYPIGRRFIEALSALRTFDSTLPNKLMAAEIMAALSSQDVQILGATLRNLDEQLRRSEEHTSELQSRVDLVCRLLLEKKKKKNIEHKTEAINITSRQTARPY